MKKNIAVLAGGYSSEYVISLRSAETIVENIDKELFNVFLIHIKKDIWEVQSDNACGIPINKNDFSFSLNNQKTTFDAVYMIIHGTPGEDGRLQAYFEMLGIPVTTGGTLAMSLSFDKFYCNQFLKAQNILVADSVRVQKGIDFSSNEIIEKLGLPLFVKPANAGSSFGISKVKSGEELLPAIEKAMTESNDVLIEQFIAGREFTVGVFASEKEDYLLPVTEIISANEFFDYEAKYTPELAQEITPADIDKKTTLKIQQKALEIYKLLNLNGIARVDFILNNEKLYFLEINTVPGMSKESIVPKQIAEAGYNMKNFLSLVIKDAINRGK